MRIQSHLKKPTRAIPSTITIMPKINRIVSQLMPVLLPDVSPDKYQDSVVKMLLKFSVSNFIMGQLSVSFDRQLM